MSGNSIENTGKAIGVIKSIMEIAEDSPELSAAGKDLAVSAKTLTGLLRNCLLPIAAINYGFDKARKYFEDRFPRDIESATANIPLENLIEPPPIIAAQTIQGLTFAHEEESIKEMYLSLLASAMDSRTSPKVHPAFSQIVSQLGANDAKLFGALSNFDALPICQIKLSKPKSSSEEIKLRHVLPYFYEDESKRLLSLDEVEDMPILLDNLARLGLIQIRYDRTLAKKDAYDWIPNHPRYVDFNAEEHAEGTHVDVDKGALILTDFGGRFAAVAVPHTVSVS